MNKVIIIGRLTRDPDIRYSNNNNEQFCIARFTVAVDRRYNKDGEQSADFISCISFGKAGEFAEKYLKQGVKIAVEGRIQTGSYTDKDGNKKYTTDVITESVEFAESKRVADGKTQEPPKDDSKEGFISVPAGAADDLPFKQR